MPTLSLSVTTKVLGTETVSLQQVFITTAEASDFVVTVRIITPPSVSWMLPALQMRANTADSS
jgi:hypothetical protein